MDNVSPLAAPRLSKAQLEAFEAAKSFVHYTELFLSGAIMGPFDPSAKCIRQLDDNLRLMKLQGFTPAASALPSATPTAYSKALNPAGKCLQQAHVDGMDDMLRSTEPRAFDHVAEASAISGIALNLSTGEVAA